MPDEFVKVANQADVSPGTAIVVEIAGQKIALCHSTAGFFAVADVCSHDGAPLGEGELIGEEIECPRHGARFDIKSGKATCLPAVVGIPTYPVAVRGDEIWISATPKSKA